MVEWSGAVRAVPRLRGSLRVSLRTGVLHPLVVSLRGLDRASSPQSLQTTAGCYNGAWSFMWQDSHQLVDVSIQDAPTVKPTRIAWLGDLSPGYAMKMPPFTSSDAPVT